MTIGFFINISTTTTSIDLEHIGVFRKTMLFPTVGIAYLNTIHLIPKGPRVFFLKIASK
jgi:hypothetical protein